MALKSAAKKSSTPAPAAVAPVSVPSAGGDGQLTSRANSLLKAFSKKAKPEKIADKKAARPELNQTPESIEALKKFAPLKELSEILTAQADAAKAILYEENFNEFLKVMWRAKGQPSNMKIVAKDGDDIESEAQFVVVEKFSVNMPEVGEDEEPEEVLSRLLQEQCGLSERDANNLVSEEVDFTPQLTIDLTAQMHGQKSGKAFVEPSAEQKKATNRLFMWLNCVNDDGNPDDQPLPLSFAQRELIKVSVKHSPVVMPGFLQRVCGYCSTEDQLKQVLSIVKPQLQIRGAKFLDQNPQHHERLRDKANEFLKDALGG